jgi:hypothetical protein
MAYGDLPLIESATDPSLSVPGFPVRIPNSPTGPKTCVLRLPDTAELLTYLGSLKTRVRFLGNRKTKDEDVPNPAAALKLFKALRIDRVANADADANADAEWDADEAQYAIDTLTMYRIKDCERTGEQAFTVTLSTLFGDVTHTVSIPFQRDRAEYQRRCYDATTLPHGVEERRYPPEVPCALYDKVILNVIGYVDPADTPGQLNGDDARRLVPPHHKRGVVVELLQQLSALDPAIDPNS